MRAEFGSPRSILVRTTTVFEDEDPRLSIDNPCNIYNVDDIDETTLIWVDKTEIDPTKVTECVIEDYAGERHKRVRFQNWVLIGLANSEKDMKLAVINYLKENAHPRWFLESKIRGCLQFCIGSAIRRHLKVLPEMIGIWHNMAFLGYEFEQGYPSKKS